MKVNGPWICFEVQSNGTIDIYEWAAYDRYKYLGKHETWEEAIGRINTDNMLYFHFFVQYL